MNGLNGEQVTVVGELDDNDDNDGLGFDALRITGSNQDGSLIFEEQVLEEAELLNSRNNNNFVQKTSLDMCLAHRFAMYPTMLVPDGAFMIDRRMGVYEHPLEIQVLFYAALRAAKELLLPDDCNQICLSNVHRRLETLTYHVREYYWLDLQRLNEIYRFQGDEFGKEVANRFNIYPGSIPNWLMEWLPETGGYLAGNLGPGRMDFRFFALGNLLAIITSLASEAESQSIMNLIEQRWQDLVGNMPMKICFPAVEGEEWRVVTGADPKNIPWSYHNGGN